MFNKMSYFVLCISRIYLLTVLLMSSLVLECQSARKSRSRMHDPTWRDRWQNVTANHSAGGTLMTQYDDVTSCLQACSDVIENCVAVDVVSRAGSDVIECWVHSDVTDLEVTFHVIGVTQYRLLTRYGLEQVCDKSGAAWLLFSNLNSLYGSLVLPDSATLSPAAAASDVINPSFPGGPSPSTTNLIWTADGCLEACSSDASCLAVDYNSVTGDCYAHRDVDFEATRGFYPRVSQFQIVRRCRPGDKHLSGRTTPATPTTTTTTTTTTSTTPTPSTTTPTPTIAPTTTSFTPTTTTTTTHKTRLTPSIPLSTRTTTTTSTTTTEPITGCQPEWIINPRTHSPGGYRYTPDIEKDIASTPDQHSQALTEACLDYCQSLVGVASHGGCLAVDVDEATDPGSCWVHTSVRRLTAKYRLPGCTQYEIIRCPLQQDVHLCYPEYTTKLHDDDFASSASSGLEVHDACGTTCLPSWLKQPDIDSASASLSSAELSDCLERCLGRPGCIAVDVITNQSPASVDTRPTTAASSGSSSSSSSQCVIRLNSAALTVRRPGTVRYELLDRCGTECRMNWIEHPQTRFRLLNPVHLHHVTSADCAATCRKDPNCVVYEVRAGRRHGHVTSSCRLATGVDYLAGTSQCDHVTSYRRSDWRCKLKAFQCQASWVTTPNVEPLATGNDDDVTNGNSTCTLEVTSVSQCLDACLVTSPAACVGVAVRRSHHRHDVTMRCRLLCDENQLTAVRQSANSDVYAVTSRCYARDSPDLRLMSQDFVVRSLSKQDD